MTWTTITSFLFGFSIFFLFLSWFLAAGSAWRHGNRSAAPPKVLWRLLRSPRERVALPVSIGLLTLIDDGGATGFTCESRTSSFKSLILFSTLRMFFELIPGNLYTKSLGRLKEIKWKSASLN